MTKPKPKFECHLRAASRHPWQIDEHNDVCFIVRDVTGQALGYFYLPVPRRHAHPSAPLPPRAHDDPVSAGQDDRRLRYSAFEADGAGVLGSGRSGSLGIDDASAHVASTFLITSTRVRRWRRRISRCRGRVR